MSLLDRLEKIRGHFEESDLDEAKTLTWIDNIEQQLQAAEDEIEIDLIEQKIELIERSLQPIKNLVFSGGGARGVVYAGAYKALVETGVFKTVENVAGSSAGSIIAALLAVGMPTSELHRVLLSTKFEALLGARTHWWSYERDAKPLHQFIRTLINQSVRTYLESINPLDASCTPILETLTANDEDAMITFADLYILRQRYPQQFKNLAITAVRASDGCLNILKYESTPNLEIAYACKASGAIPGVFAPVEIDEEYYVDGGIYDNTPTTAFDEPDGPKNSNPAQTLVFAFMEGKPNAMINENSSIFKIILSYFNWDNFFRWRNFFTTPALFQALYGTRIDEDSDLMGQEIEPPRLYSPGFFEAIAKNTITPLISKLNPLGYTVTDRKEAGFQNIRKNYPLRTVGLNVENLLALDFCRATKTAGFMSACGYLDTLDMIYHHNLNCDAPNQNEFYKKLVDDFKAFYEEIRNQHPLEPDDDLYQQLTDQENQWEILTQYHFIREWADKNPNSYQAVALAKAVHHDNEMVVDEPVKMVATM